MAVHFKPKKFKVNRKQTIEITGDVDLSPYQPLSAIYMKTQQVSFWTFENYTVDDEDCTFATLDVTPGNDSFFADEDLENDASTSGDLIIVLQDPTQTNPPLGPIELVSIDT